MKTKNATVRGAGLAVAVTCFMALGGWESAAHAAGAPVKSTTQCYATRNNPDDITCYRHSWKAEFRHGDVVYVPILIQVPKPAHPSSVVYVGSLDDIRPSATTGA
ncbi:hypothetical protein ACH4NF_30790 [Streptomyces sp. NPDC017248]|uniref:hypothetical protein n=1 Tax=unclassified Streptomyces TaxID=2593676 RepID=UPI0037B6A741